jgi:hypothetical protein
MRLRSTTPTSDNVSVNFATIIIETPSKAIINMKAARPSICLKPLLSLGKNNSPTARDEMSKTPMEDEIPMRGDAIDVEFKRSKTEKTSNKGIMIHGDLILLAIRFFTELVISTRL